MFQFTSIEQYQAQLQEGKITCRDTVEQFLLRIREKKHLNAFVEVFADEAIQIASRLDEERRNGRSPGKLHGVIIGIKDVICYKDHHVTAASAILKDFTSIYSATAVERLLAEDAIIIGSLNCDEFAMGSTNETSVYGKVLNPLDESRVPGGSSGGSAAAVQAGLCMVSLGSDTGGSVRQPADFCGIIGLKPGYGRISRYGLIAYASSFDQIGVFGLSIPDVALLLEVMAGPDEFDSTVLPDPVPVYTPASPDLKYRFAWLPATLEHPGLDPEISRSIRETISALQHDGHQADPIDFKLLDYLVPAYYVLTTAEASSNLARYDGVKFGHRTAREEADLADWYKATRSEGFGREVKRRIMLGTFVLSAGYYDAYFTRAQQVRRLLRDQVGAIFRNYDFIIMPVSPVTAFRSGEGPEDPIAMYLADIYTVMANLVGIPAISLPLYRHPDGLPFGLQVMSNRGNEVSLLRVSNLLLGDYTMQKVYDQQI